jgi:hypothetical protein
MLLRDRKLDFFLLLASVKLDRKIIGYCAWESLTKKSSFKEIFAVERKLKIDQGREFIYSSRSTKVVHFIAILRAGFYTKVLILPITCYWQILSTFIYLQFVFCNF